ncbi:hypothetical protein BO71DRAFT_404421 [Aspergillus ellipticus CBS 707.79]|uniref:Uncharacterized protein n=1 Tax=Aspergillus ellipticus CBS 707.79 TaxID=1448320 RepID=A0A319CTN8_9EURO|nr:hypothetical protein BO71DRAFT_404421 [Aspergillus ellipticus CBS 707.79]
MDRKCVCLGHGHVSADILSALHQSCLDARLNGQLPHPPAPTRGIPYLAAHEYPGAIKLYNDRYICRAVRN